MYGPPESVCVVHVIPMSVCKPDRRHHHKHGHSQIEHLCDNTHHFALVYQAECRHILQIK